MHTVIITLVGIGLFVLFHLFAPKTKALKWFLVTWLVISVLHLIAGVFRGYSLKSELWIHLIVFGVPAAAAILMKKK